MSIPSSVQVHYAAGVQLQLNVQSSQLHLSMTVSYQPWPSPHIYMIMKGINALKLYSVKKQDACFAFHN